MSSGKLEGSLARHGSCWMSTNPATVFHQDRHGTVYLECRLPRVLVTLSVGNLECFMLQHVDPVMRAQHAPPTLARQARCSAVLALPFCRATSSTRCAIRASSLGLITWCREPQPPGGVGSGQTAVRGLTGPEPIMHMHMHMPRAYRVHAVQMSCACYKHAVHMRCIWLTARKRHGLAKPVRCATGGDEPVAAPVAAPRGTCRA